MQYWLMKSEPTEYSIDHLRKDGSSSWFGVRNYLARNYMRDYMKVGDMVLFYHSSCLIPGISGIAEVSSHSHPDETQFLLGDKHFDPKSTREKPIWYCVDVSFIKKFDRIVSITELRSVPGLEALKILEKGNRLSITPVTENEYNLILGLVS